MVKRISKIIILAILAFLIPSNVFAINKKSDGGLRLDNNMQYKNVTKWGVQSNSPELDQVLNKAKNMKDSGQWALKDDEIKGSFGATNNSVEEQTVGQYGGLLRSIPQKYKSTYNRVSPTIKERASKSKFDVNRNYINTPEYQKAIKDNLATQFDISSPGSIMTPAQWKAFLKHKKPSGKYIYNVNGSEKMLYQKDALAILVDACFKASADAIKHHGKTINPDFLIALSMNETGWGSNKLARKYNSWFSVNATNVNTEKNARKYNNTSDAVEDAIKLLYKYIDPNDYRFDKGLGPSIMGANTYYAQNDRVYSPNLSWTNTITSIMRQCAEYNNVKIPTF